MNCDTCGKQTNPETEINYQNTLTFCSTNCFQKWEHAMVCDTCWKILRSNIIRYNHTGVIYCQGCWTDYLEKVEKDSRNLKHILNLKGETGNKKWN